MDKEKIEIAKLEQLVYEYTTGKIDGKEICDYVNGFIR